MNDLQKAFVLHSRTYSETSLLVDLLTRENGRICVIAKGARAVKSAWKGLLQLFVPLMVNWYGRGELPVLRTAEAYDRSLCLTNRNAMFCGFYLNELLMRVLPRFDAYTNVFDLYEKTIHHLNNTDSLPSALRHFEKELLKELGYALQLTEEANSKQKIKPNQKYVFSTQNDFYCIKSDVPTETDQTTFWGRSLLAIAQDDYTNAEVLHDAKRLMRLAFQPLLGHKPLKSRDLWG